MVTASQTRFSYYHMIKTGRPWFNPHKVDLPNSLSHLQICTIEALWILDQLPPAATVKL